VDGRSSSHYPSDNPESQNLGENMSSLLALAYLISSITRTQLNAIAPQILLSDTHQLYLTPSIFKSEHCSQPPSTRLTCQPPTVTPDPNATSYTSDERIRTLNVTQRHKPNLVLFQLPGNSCTPLTTSTENFPHCRPPQFLRFLHFSSNCTPTISQLEIS
jgi:hypothetical protein